MYVPTLPVTDIILIIAVFGLGIFFAYREGRFRITGKMLCLYLLSALLLTYGSLLIVGSRGGMPPASVYGWPKEFIYVREHVFSLNQLYFFEDIVFYTMFTMAFDAVRRSAKK